MRASNVEKDLFGELKTGFLDFDPAYFIQNNLTLDGSEFKILGNGWKFMADVYRYIALQATQSDGKPVVIKKGRQVGATMMAGALDLYFTNSGLFNNPPIRVLHLFPTLPLVKKFTQDKLEGLVRTAKSDFVNKNKLKSQNAVDNLTMKQFKTGTLWVDSLGADGDRVRGMTVDAIFFDECFPYHQFIETEDGKWKIGKLYNFWKDNKKLPKVKTYNEQTESFEYKNITNAWSRGEKSLLQITCGNREVRCTPNHKFLTDNGWKEASELTIGNLIKTSVNTNLHIRALNDDQMQIVLGSFLGDGHLSKHKLGRYRLVEIHGIKQQEYCKWKASIFNTETIFLPENGYAKTPAVRFCSKVFGLQNELPETKTTCPQWVLDKIDARGIAIWFMDDGSTNFWGTGASAVLSTCSFDIDSQQRFVEKFKLLGIDCHYAICKRKNGKDLYSIYFNKKGFNKLCELITPYVHENIWYKISKSNKTLSNYIWNNKFKNYGFTIVDSVIKLEKQKKVYDIEVEDNHNFIVCSSATSKNKGGLIAHNCQDMIGHAIGNATKTLTAAKYGQTGRGVQVFFGTPKQRSSYFNTIWEMSDQRYYHLGCIKCKETYPFYMPNSDEWMKIWVSEFTIECPLCHHRQHKSEAIECGKWVASKDSNNAQHIGFHINQLYIPYFAKEDILKLRPENNPTMSERLWNNEVIGEFYSGSGLPLTKQEVLENCIDQDRYFSKKIDPKVKSVYLGLDWGHKVDNDLIERGQSYSCSVVLSATHDGILLVEHANKLKERGFNYKIDVVDELYRRFGVRRGAADFFFGQDVVQELQLKYRDKFLGARGSGTLRASMKYDEEELMITYNKDLIIDEVLELLRKGKIRFPGKSYEYCEWLIEHCTSMDLDVRTSGGQAIKTYQKGSIQNDGLMALIYAYIAYKFDITKGFTIKPGFEEKRQAMLPKLAYMPRWKG